MGKSKPKMVLTLNYIDYVFDEDVAIELFKLLNRSEIEMLDSKWHSETKTSTRYIKPLDSDPPVLKRMTPENYAVLRLAAAALENNNG